MGRLGFSNLSGTLPSFRGRGTAAARASPPASQGGCLNATPQVGRAEMYFTGNMTGCHGDTSSVGVACHQDVKEPGLFTSRDLGISSVNKVAVEHQLFDFGRELGELHVVLSVR